MSEKVQERVDNQNVSDGIDQGKRRLLKVALGSAALYTVPLMASFPMEGLRVRQANAGGIIEETCVERTFGPPGLFASNQQTGRAFRFHESPSDNPNVACQPPGFGSVKQNVPGEPFEGGWHLTLED